MILIAILEVEDFMPMLDVMEMINDTGIRCKELKLSGETTSPEKQNKQVKQESKTQNEQ